MIPPVIIRPLHALHLEDLHKSGLSDETIAAAKIYSVCPQDIPRILGWNPPITSAMAIPYLGTNFVSLKVFPMFLDKEGHKVKYLHPKGSGVQLYIPPGISSKLDNATNPLYITEGEKKALKAAQEGLCCVSLSGVDCWKNKGESTPIPALARLISKQRQVFLVFDSDFQQNGNVRRALQSLGKALQELGAMVRVIVLPTGDSGAKIGLDDFLCAHQIVDLNDLPTIDLGALEGISRTVQPDGQFSISSLNSPFARSQNEAQWPKPLGPEAFYGLPGDIVRIIEPQSEADPAALLVQFLVAFGNVVGRKPHWKAEDDKHFTNEFLVLIGESSKSRKGSSWSRIRRFFELVDPGWVKDNVVGGLSSGEGLIWRLRDPIEKVGKVEDSGVEDKRLLVFEAEFASILRMIERKGSILSEIVRSAWDTGTLSTLTKNSPTKATDTLVSIVGNITIDELRRHLSLTEIGNGFGNRFLWLCVRRSKNLPFGGILPDVEVKLVGQKIRDSVDFAKSVDVVGMDKDAMDLWCEVYEELSGGRPGMSGALSSRAEAHTRRLACLYALTDLSSVVRKEHLLAALEIIRYVQDSLRFVFGNQTGDPVADKILQALRCSDKGLSKTEISGMFARHLAADRLDSALAFLERCRLVRSKKTLQEGQVGRPGELWFLA